MTMTSSKLIQSQSLSKTNVHSTYIPDISSLYPIVDFGTLCWKYFGAISIFLVTMWITILMTMTTILKRIRIVEIKFSLIAAIIENLVM